MKDARLLYALRSIQMVFIVIGDIENQYHLKDRSFLLLLFLFLREKSTLTLFYSFDYHSFFYLTYLLAGDSTI